MAKSKSKSKSQGNSSKPPNAWMAHVKRVGAENPGMGLRDILVKAKASYKKEKHGGSLVVLPMLGGSKGQSGGQSALAPANVSGGMSHSSGTALQMKAAQFSGGKKSKRRGSKRSGSKRSSRGTKRSGSKHSSRGTKRRSRGGMRILPPLSPGDLKNVEFF